jgi:hypothetical protein
LSIAVVAPPAYDGVVISVPSSLEEQVALADVIVVGEVTDVRSRRVPDGIETDVTIAREQTLKGPSGASISVTLPGGEVGDVGIQVGGVPNFLVGERVLVFVSERNGRREMARLWHSKYALAGDRAIQLESNTQMSIAALEQRLSNALGRPTQIDEEDAIVSMPFQATYCGAWPLASQPVPHYVNTAGPGSGGPAGLAFLALVYDSLHNWQALSNSHVSFVVAGTTSASPMSTGDGLSVVGWANITTPNVLGQNGCQYNPSTGSILESDTRIDTSGPVWDPDESISPGAFSLRAVMEHELGHGLGLGHTQVSCDGSASTPLMCAFVSAGVRKRILMDDAAGAQARYPLSGSPPGAPSNLNVTVASASSNSLSWSASSGAVVSYDIERSSTGCGGSFASIQTVAAAATSYLDNGYGGGLPAGSYCYRVKALGRGGDSGYSNADAPGAAVQKGDANANGSITMADALITSQCAIGMGCSGVNMTAADTDCSGTVTTSDALRIAQRTLGIIPSFPC